VNKQLSPDTQAAGEPTEHPGQRRWNNLDGARKRVSGITESGALNALTWAILYILRVIAVTLCVVAVVLLPILIFGGERPTSIKGYVDSITWGWLTLNGVPPKLGSATITLIPWGLAVIPWALLFRAGRSFSLRTNHANRWRVIGAVIMVMTYVASITAAAHLTTSINVSFSSSWALIVSVLMGVSAISIGVLRGGSVHFAAPIPPLALFVARRGAGVILTLMGVAAILLSVRLLTNYSSVVDLFTGLNPGWSGILGLLALTLGYLPVLIVWSAAYIVGAGFSIGPDVMVSPFIPVTAPTQLPPFPPLVAIPETAGAVAWALPVLVVVIGILCGVGISKSLCKENALIRMLMGFAIAFVAATIFYFLAVLSLGNLGDVRLVALGPDPLLSASLLWILLAVGITPTAVLPARAFTRSQRPRISIVPVATVDETVPKT